MHSNPSPSADNLLLFMSVSCCFASSAMLGLCCFRWVALFLVRIATPQPRSIYIVAQSCAPCGYRCHGCMQGRTTAEGEFVDCGEYPERVQYDTASGVYPALEALLCSLVRQPPPPGAAPDGGDGGGVYGE